MEWEVIIKWLPKFIQGAILTLELVSIAVILGLILAIPLGIARSSRHLSVRALPYAMLVDARRRIVWRGFRCWWNSRFPGGFASRMKSAS